MLRQADIRREAVRQRSLPFFTIERRDTADRRDLRVHHSPSRRKAATQPDEQGAERGHLFVVLNVA